MPAIAAAPTARTTGSFVGTIVEEDGSPLPPQTAAWIDFRDLAGARKLGTPEDDRIVLRDLPLGTYAATVYAYARRMAADRIELTTSQPDVVKEFRLPRLPSLVVSVVTPDGRPFYAARIASKAPDFLHEIVPVATREPPGPRFEAMRGDGTDPVGVGEFWASEPSKEYRAPTVMGTLMLHAELPVYVNLILGQVAIQSKRVERGATEVTFVLSLEDAAAALPSLRVHVLDDVTSLPVDDAKVVLGCGRRGGVVGRTDPAGDATLDPVLPGKFTLLCDKEGYARTIREVELEPGKSMDLAVRLVRPLEVEVHVLGPDGKPCAASVGVAQLHKDSRYSLQHIEVLKSNAHGNCMLRGLERGIYVLGNPNGGFTDPNRLVEGPLAAANVLLDTTSGEPSQVEVRLSKAVTLWIRSPPGDPVDLEFEVTDARNLPVWSQRFDLPWPCCLRLAPGSYHVRFRDSTGKVLQEKAVELVASPVEVSFGG